jgi:glycerol-3-phosphate acyltransferase PlsY
MINGIIAVVIAYLLGSIPVAYIVTRITKRKDIRKLGGGNVGAHNVFENVGRLPGIAVGILDVGKGVASVFIALALIDSADYRLFVFGAGLAAVIGHIWPVYLKFKGGNGIATTIGILSILLTRELLIALGFTLLILVITRNPILSVNISLLIVIPVTSGLLHDSWQEYVVFSLILIVILVINFLPTARAALANAGNKENLTAELMRYQPKKPAGKKRKKEKQKR